MRLRILLFFTIIFYSTHLFAQSGKQEIRVIKTFTIYFDHDRTNLRADALSTLDSALLVLMQDSLRTVHIIAHTDSTGSAYYNQKLSNKRAQSVYDFFTKGGIPFSRMVIESKGREDPLATNNTEQGRQLNRRATIDIHGPVKSTDPLDSKILMDKGYTVIGTVVDAETGEGISANLVFYNIDPPLKLDSINTDSETGSFKEPQLYTDLIKIECEAKNYFFQTIDVDLPDLANDQMVVELKIEMKKATTGSSLALKEIYFVTNEADILEESEPQLQKLLKFLVMNPELNIKIGGHINLPGLEPWNVPDDAFYLSGERAFTIYKFLKSNGIDKNRISYEGYGNTQMVYPNPQNQEEAQMNRRVEITIVK